VRQLLEDCGLDEVPRSLVRERDAFGGAEFRRQAALLDIKEIIAAPQSPWQNPYAERVIGSIRRESLDHSTILGGFHLKCVLASYTANHHSVRTHLSLGKDTPHGRSIQVPEEGKIVERVRGLNHE